MTKTCFIIQPLHDRADEVLERYIEPALKNDFVLHEPGKQVSSSIKQDIFDHLREDNLVLCFLGAPFMVPAAGSNWLWNGNVMLEAGYRLGLEEPIIFVREKKVQPEEPMMPFDLNDHSAIELLPPASELPRDNRLPVVTKIAKAARDAVAAVPGETRRVTYGYPAASMAFGGEGGRIVAASDDAAEFYRYPPGTNLIGLDVNAMVDQLTAQIIPSQRAAFQAEQDSLIGALVRGKRPTATVCIVFGKDSIGPSDMLDNAYLPIVSRFEAANGAPTILEVLYLNVKGAASIWPDGVVRCRFGSQQVNS